LVVPLLITCVKFGLSAQHVPHEVGQAASTSALAHCFSRRGKVSAFLPTQAQSFSLPFFVCPKLKVKSFAQRSVGPAVGVAVGAEVVGSFVGAGETVGPVVGVTDGTCDGLPVGVLDGVLLG